MKTFGFSNWCVWRVLEFEDKAVHNMPQFSTIHNNTIWFPIEFIRRLRACLGISRLLVPFFFFESEFPKPDSAPENDLWIDLKTPYFRVTLVTHSSHSSELTFQLLQNSQAWEAFAAALTATHWKWCADQAFCRHSRHSRNTKKCTKTSHNIESSSQLSLTVYSASSHRDSFCDCCSQGLERLRNRVA